MNLFGILKCQRILKNPSADIIYEIYPASITKCSVKFFADIYY